MATNLLVISGSLPAGFCPVTYQELSNAFAAALTVQLPGSNNTFVTGNATPSAEDRDKPWIRTGVAGEPDRTYVFFNGSWLSLHPDFVGKIVMWEGVIADITTLDGGDSSGIGDASGPMWEEVTAARARSPLHPGTFASGTVVAAAGTFGEEKHSLVGIEVTRHSHRTKFGLATADGVTSTSSGSLLQKDGTFEKDSENSLGETTVGASAGHNTVHPVYGVYLIRRTQRKYYKAI